MPRLPENWSAAFVDGLAGMAPFPAEARSLVPAAKHAAERSAGSLSGRLDSKAFFRSLTCPAEGVGQAKVDTRTCTLTAAMVSSLQADAQQIADELGPLKDGEAEKFLRNHPLQTIFE